MSCRNLSSKTYYETYYPSYKGRGRGSRYGSGRYRNQSRRRLYDLKIYPVHSPLVHMMEEPYEWWESPLFLFDRFERTLFVILSLSEPYYEFRRQKTLRRPLYRPSPGEHPGMMKEEWTSSHRKNRLGESQRKSVLHLRTTLQYSDGSSLIFSVAVNPQTKERIWLDQLSNLYFVNDHLVIVRVRTFWDTNRSIRKVFR